jgi:two-component system, OmpR family, response regulator RegX3
MKTKVLLIDDDALLRQSLTYRLEQEGYQITTSMTGEEGIRAARRDPPDLVLLDIGLPDYLGLDVARILRQELNVPIIFLTARQEETDIVVGLELGAEDYITKPFGTRELLARMRVVLRRASRPVIPLESQVLRVGDVMLDTNAHEVRVRNELVELPPKEFELLRLLLANAGTVLTTDYLLKTVWGEEFSGAQQVLYVHIGWLRERIERDARHPRYIVTVRGVGYKFAAGEKDT